MSFWIIVAVVAAAVLSVIFSYNGIVKHYNAVKRAWANVHNYERQKVKILESLQPQVAQYTDYEKGLQTQITELRSSIDALDAGEPRVGSLRQVEAKTQEVMQGLSVTMENYPDLKANELFLNLMEEITSQNENVGAAISIFNRDVEQFNARIKMFPHNLVNASLNRKHHIDEFSDSSAAENIEYQPEF